MKIFISWSKDSSKVIANALFDWIPKVTMGNVKTWCSASPVCVPHGSGFPDAILSAAMECDACLVILDRTSINGWWTNFESGLFFGQRKKVYAILCGDLTHQNLGGAGHPLSVNGVNYTQMSIEGLTNLLVSLKSNDRDWISLDFKSAVTNNFDEICRKYDAIFGDKYLEMASLLVEASAKDEDLM